MKQPHGFTLLAAILFPVFAKAHEKARQVTCQSSEKQLGLAMLQYVQDNDEIFPDGLVHAAPSTTTGGGAASSTGAGLGWARAMLPYIKSPAMLKCPNDATVHTAAAVSNIAVVCLQQRRCLLLRDE